MSIYSERTVRKSLNKLKSNNFIKEVIDLDDLRSRRYLC